MGTQTDPEIEALRERVAELEDLIGAIQEHRVDAFLVGGAPARRVMVLESAEMPYRALIEEVQQGVVTLDESGRILFCNQRFVRMAKIDERALVGVLLADLVAARERPALESLLEAARSAPVQGQLHLRLRTTAELPVSLAVDRLGRETGAAFGVLVSDLTSELEQRERARQVERKDEFMAILSHELRNSLGTARNATAVMRKLAAVSEEQHRACDWVDRQINLMTRLIDDLLDVERIAHGKLGLKLERLDLRDAVRSICEDLRPEVAGAGLALELRLPDQSVWVDADPMRLTQVLGNLLQNARKFSGQGGAIRVCLERAGAEALLRVEDEGVGIDPETLARVFVAFQQGRNDRGGLGLGLALVRGLVELHGGSVEAASAGQGRGACFTVRLPSLDAGS